jgi:lysophospholipase L1-like esterase
MARTARLVLTGCVAAALMAACGGGTSQFEPFQPEQYVAFGDETSVIRSDGRRYTVNPLDTAGALSCATQPIWTQAVATRFGFVFAECNPSGATSFKALMRAAAGARADDVKTQIDDQLARGGFAAKTLVTVLAGANDVLDLYGQYPRQTEEQLIAEARARGERLAQQVNRLVGIGPRVIVSTVPDVGLSPYALAQKAAFTDTDRAALISRLVAAFNARLRTTILNDGRYIGLVLADEVVQSIAKLPAVYGITNATGAVCTAALPDCTDQTLVESGSSAAWLWADDRRLAYGGHLRLGSLAVARAVGNPF